MTEPLDPCEELEIVVPEEESGPSVLPVTASYVAPIEAAFPFRENREIEATTIRESLLVNQQNFDLPYTAEEIRNPIDIVGFNRFNDRLYIDPFRYCSGKFFQFKNSRLSFVNASNKTNQKVGTFYEIKAATHVLGNTEKSDMRLIFDKQVLASLLAGGRFSNVFPSKFLTNWILGDDYPLVEDGWPMLINKGITYIDDVFSAPAAFFEGEIGESTLGTFKDSVSISSHVGPLTIEETESEHTKRSIYRHYKSRIVEGHPEVVSDEKIQKFSADNVQELNHINILATDFMTGGDFFRSSQAIVNNYTKISITANHSSNISKIFKEQELDTYLLDYIDTYNSSSSPIYAQILDQSFLGGVPNNTVVSDYQPNKYSYDKFIGSEYGIRSMLEESKSETKNYPLSYEDALEDFDTRSTGDPVAIDFRLLARKRTLESKIKTFIADKKRSFMNILEGKKAFSEVVAYRVEKRDALTGDIIQNFYFFNDPETNNIEFLDTQVVYEKIYDYRIYAINFVVGNSYNYDHEDRSYSLADFDIADPFYDFKVRNRTILSFIETPYFRQQVKAIDKPPVPPEAEILPFFQEDNRVSFRLTPGSGNLLEEPVIILAQDRQAIAEMLISNPESQGSVRYSSDTLPKQYQMLILESEPAEYSDFSAATLYTVNTSYNSGYIEVGVVPNKTYYLTFRSSDPAGISNPTHVYKLKLNSYANGIFVEYEEFDMNGSTNNTPIEFERVLSVEPSSKQSSIKFDSLEELGLDFYQTAPSLSDLTLGLDEQNRLWGRKFKIRLVSRSTSRAIDLNIKFKDSYSVVKVEENLIISSETDNPSPPDSNGNGGSQNVSSNSNSGQQASDDAEREVYEADPTRSAPLGPRGY